MSERQELAAGEQLNTWLRCVAVIAMVMMACARPAVSQAQICPSWVDANPMARYAMAMAYDSRRGVTVMFGGASSSGQQRDTREWDGETWTLRAESGPPAYDDPKMVFDSARGVCVLVTKGQTWEWDGETWSLREAGRYSSQGIREHFALAYDEARHCTVLFGGEPYSSSAHPNDTWTWNGSQWRQVATSGPPGRSYAAMAYDPLRQRVVLFGGNTTAAAQGDTWEFDGTTWTLAGSTPALARSSPGMTYSHALRKIVLLSGAPASGSDGSAWSWDGQTWTRLPTAGVEPRSRHGFVEDQRRGVLVCVGGYFYSTSIGGQKTFGDVREWAPTTNPPSETYWDIKDDHTAPSPRRGAASAYDSVREVLVMFGGSVGSGSDMHQSGETWEWNGERWTLRSLTGPPPRSVAAMCFDRDRGVTVMHGGWDSGIPMGWRSDTWEWNGNSWTRRIDLPFLIGTMVYDEARRVSVLFACPTNVNPPISRQTWTWDGISWTLKTTTGPAPRGGQAMAYDPDRQVIYLHGGSNQSVTFGDLWEWNGTLWQQRQQISPFARYYHQIAYDRRERRLVGWGGYANQTPYVGTGWAWDEQATEWQLLEPGSEYRTEFVMQYVEARQKIMRFGGAHALSLYNDTYEFEFQTPPIPAWAAPSDFNAWRGSYALFRIGPYNGLNPVFQWRRNGVPLQDGDNISGATNEILEVYPVDFDDAASYDVIVTNECSQVISPAATLTVRRRGDVNSDGFVNAQDIAMVVNSWGLCPPIGSCQADIAPSTSYFTDGVVDVQDLLAVIQNFGS